MRCLAILMLEDIKEIRGNQTLFNPADSLRFSELPNGLPLFCYGEIELDPDQWSVAADVLWQLVDMDGATVGLITATGITPTKPQQDIPLVWRLQHQARFPFARPGRYELRLYVNGELLADRPIVVELTA